MRVAILIETRRFDGPIRNLIYALDELAGRVSPSFVMIARPGQISQELVQALDSRRIPLHIIIERFRFDPVVIFKLRGLLRRIAPDIAQVHNTKSRLFLLLTSFLPGAHALRRTVFFFHGETWTSRLQRHYNRLDRGLFRMAPMAVVVTPAQKDLLSSWRVKPQRIAVLPNAIPPAAHRDESLVDANRIMTAGRLSLEKGHHLLIEGFSAIAHSRPQVRLDIYGEGPEEENLKNLVRRLGIADRAIFHGYRNSLDAAYDAAGLFVLPSLTEGLPNVLLEAASRGVPIVATSVGGVPDLFVSGVHAQLVRPGSESALREAMDAYFADPDRFRRLAVNARQHVREKFSPAAKAQGLLDIYTSVLSAR